MAEKSVCEIGSRLQAAHASVDWLRTIALHVEVYLDLDPNRIGAPHLKLARKRAKLAEKAIEQGDAEGAAMLSLAALQAAWQAEIAEGRVMIDAGVTAYRKAEKANEQKRSKAEAEHDEWRRQAAEIQARATRKLTKKEIAAKIDPARANYIRKLL